MRRFFSNTKPFGQLVTLVITVVLFFIIAGGVTLIAAIVGTDVTEIHNLRWLQGVTQLLTLLLPALVVAFLFSDGVRDFLKLDFSSHSWVKALLAVIVLFLLLPFSDWLTTVNDNWHLPQSLSELEQGMRDAGATSENLVEQMLSLTGAGNLAMNLIVMALIPAICEEFFFRGALQQILMRWMRNPHVAIFVTAAIFSLVHGEIFAFLPRFMLGVLLGYLFYISGSVLVNVAVHFVNNATIVVIYYLYNIGCIKENIADNINAPWYVTLICTIAACVCFYFFFIRRKNKIQTT